MQARPHSAGQGPPLVEAVLTTGAGATTSRARAALAVQRVERWARLCQMLGLSKSPFACTRVPDATAPSVAHARWSRPRPSISCGWKKT